MRLALVGRGKMGRAVAALATAEGHAVVAELGRGMLTRDALAGAEVAIEFTEPAEAPDNLRWLAEWHIPAVCGTTGWYDHLEEVRGAVEQADAALVYGPNFSPGVQLLLRLAREAGRLLAHRPELDAYLLEVHHRAKKDAPSGTALALQRALREGDATHDYPITSIRAGLVPGTHELHVEGTGEGLALTHLARDRAVFARGALLAAQWLLAAPRHGMVPFAEVLFGKETDR